jgi:IrrE N-terminal-like domain
MSSESETEKRYIEPRAHALRARYVAAFGGVEIPAPVESIAEDLLGLRIEESSKLDCSGILLPSERRILLNASEAAHNETPIRRHRFTIAHELGHWVCHVMDAPAGMEPAPSFCRAVDLTQDADRRLEREANVFAAELLMPEQVVRDAWNAEPDVDAVAERFGVSRLASHWRLYGFGLVEERPA